MRTDSVSIAEPARKEARLYIEKTFGKNFLPLKPRAYKTKTKNAQEAHEAIRPTLTARSPAQMKQYLAADEFRLYDLIWRRFVASQMEDALYDTVSVDISAGDYTFRAAGRTLKFSGFLEVYSVANDNDEDNAEQEGALPPLSAKEMLNLVQLLPEQHFTEPPPRYNEASLIKALEENGIGRPSTYAPIIHTILGRSYVRLQERRFYTTTLGALVNDILKKHFPEIVDLKFTAQVEDKLDSIAEGKADWPAVIKDFYEPFSKEIKDAEVNLIRQKVEPEKTDEVCPKCGKPMVIRESFRGRFLACSGFPACRTTYSLDKNNQKIIRPAPEKTDQTCEKCGSPMLKRAGKRGPFLACSGFPKCRNIKKLPKQDPEEPHQ
jgi:DNA topoisomerase-1